MQVYMLLPDIAHVATVARGRVKTRLAKMLPISRKGVQRVNCHEDAAMCEPDNQLHAREMTWDRRHVVRCSHAIHSARITASRDFWLG